MPQSSLPKKIICFFLCKKKPHQQRVGISVIKL